jgi:5-(carboxyamino)imidazole ribonucleotide mutase
MSKGEISIIMSSVFDMTVMKDAAKVLDQFGISYEIEILDVHRDPDCAPQYIKEALSRGVCVFIAGASGAAHLPGLIAAYTTAPVIGVPIKAIHSIDGLDAIYSILQMPQGIPVATMALNGARNAALFALQVLACKHPSYLQLVQAYKTKQRDEARLNAKNLQKMGYEQFIANAK